MVGELELPKERPKLCGLVVGIYRDIKRHVTVAYWYIYDFLLLLVEEELYLPVSSFNEDGIQSFKFYETPIWAVIYTCLGSRSFNYSLHRLVRKILLADPCAV